MNQSLDEGSSDGTYRKVRPDTEDNAMNTSAIAQSRQSLHPFFGYGFLTSEYPQPVNPGK